MCGRLADLEALRKRLEIGSTYVWEVGPRPACWTRKRNRFHVCVGGWFHRAVKQVNRISVPRMCGRLARTSGGAGAGAIGSTYVWEVG